MKAKSNKSNKRHETDLIKHEQAKDIRINKYLADSNKYSRREADRLITSGKVTVNGLLAKLGMTVRLTDVVVVNNTIVSSSNEKVYLVLNKPKGIISTSDQSIKGNITSFVNHKDNVYPIGRLDKDSTGIILLTNDGDIVNKILREEYGHEKEYVVFVNKIITTTLISQMEFGVVIYNPVSKKREKTKSCQVWQLSKNSFQIILKQGLNRQIRRMCEALGYQVTSLERIRVLNITNQNLKIGAWRYLTNQELKQINEMINFKI